MNTIESWANQAVHNAVYTDLDEGGVFGRVPGCPGAVAVAATLPEAETELLSVLREWAELGVKVGNTIPVLGGIDLNAGGGSDALPERARSDPLSPIS
ncbi:MAG: type II toxin-antitoxin system HicB family antitoxin [Chloroflexota bacterium]|nr:MAG: hypothetical protein DLM70_16195 [Chloroflexota bacterium]